MAKSTIINEAQKAVAQEYRKIKKSGRVNNLFDKGIMYLALLKVTKEYHPFSDDQIEIVENMIKNKY
jgi:hypothetical protein